MKFLTAFLFINSFLLIHLKAQDSDPVTQQLWLETMVDNAFGLKWDFYTDASLRLIYSENLQYWRVTARPNIKFQMLKWMDLRGGVGTFYTQPDEDNATLEIRPWEGFAVAWPTIIGLKFTQLVRAEQQFIFNTSDWTYKVSDRYRYQLSTKIDLNKSKKYKTFFIPLAVEIFIEFDNDADKLAKNKARYTVGLGYVVNREITFDAKFEVDQSGSGLMNSNTTDMILRLRFRYNLFSIEEDDTKI